MAQIVLEPTISELLVRCSANCSSEPREQCMRELLFTWHMYCIVLYCIVLYCIVLYCIVLYCIVLYCIVLYSILFYSILFYSILLDRIVSYCMHCVALSCLLLQHSALKSIYILTTKLIVHANVNNLK